jgi:hypothetical protein
MVTGWRLAVASQPIRNNTDTRSFLLTKPAIMVRYTRLNIALQASVPNDNQFVRCQEIASCMAKCPYCSFENIAGTLYCDFCGRRQPQPTGQIANPLDQSAGSPQAGQEAAADEERTPEKPPHLRLQLIPSGIILDLESRERIVLGRKDPDQEPDVDLAPYGGGWEQGVGRKHAMIILKQGRYYIEDLNSINKTLLNSSRLLPGQQYRLRNGDQIQLGLMVIYVLL